jgi:hypothetical protein
MSEGVEEMSVASFSGGTAKHKDAWLGRRRRSSVAFQWVTPASYIGADFLDYGSFRDIPEFFHADAGKVFENRPRPLPTYYFQFIIQ